MPRPIIRTMTLGGPKGVHVQAGSFDMQLKIDGLFQIRSPKRGLVFLENEQHVFRLVADVPRLGDGKVWFFDESPADRQTISIDTPTTFIPPKMPFLYHLLGLSCDCARCKPQPGEQERKELPASDKVHALKDVLGA